ncbi:MAG: hypothetical protein QOH45_3827, partial [Pseudonocardiales bacterium]|nr:hypothetical protein [Pseudonocardiales bacterium]
SPQDILIARSKGGSSEEVNNLAARLRHQGVKVVALTFNAASTLAQNADIAVTLRPFVEADPGGLIAMGSTLAHSAWLDALALVLMRARQYSWDKVHYSHPGGAVGAATTLPAPVEPLEIPNLNGGR